MLYEIARRNKEKVFCRMPFGHADRRLFMNSQLKTKDKTGHGHGAEITRIVEYRNRFTPCCAQSHYEGQEMIRRGDGIGGIGMRGVVDDGVIIMIPYGLDNVVVETQRLRRATRVIPFDASQVVDDVATGKNQISLSTQWRQFLAEVIQFLWREITIYGELDDGNIGVGEHMDQYGPCAVVDAPLVIDGNSRPQKVLYRPGQIGIAWYGIGDLV